MGGHYDVEKTLMGFTPFVIKRGGVNFHYVESGGRTGGCFLMAFSLGGGGVVGIIGLVATAAMLSADEFNYLVLTIFIFPLAAVPIFLFGLAAFARKLEIVVDADSARVTVKSLLGVRQWTEATANYQRLALRGKLRWRGRRKYYEYGLDMIHEDPAKTLRLHQKRSDEGMRELLSHCGGQLRLPAVDEVFKEQAPAEDKDKNIQELACEGKVAVEFDPARPPPNVVLRRDGEALEIIERSCVILYVAMGALLMMVPIVCVIIGFVTANSPVMGYFGLALAFGVFLLTVYAATSRPGLRVSPREISSFTDSPLGRRNGRQFAAADIKEIKIAVVPGGEGGRTTFDSEGRETMADITCLALTAANGQTIEFARNWPEESQEWLRRCVTAILLAGGR